MHLLRLSMPRTDVLRARRSAGEGQRPRRDLRRDLHEGGTVLDWYRVTVWTLILLGCVTFWAAVALGLWTVTR